MKIVLHRNFEKKFIKLHPKLKEQFKERRNLFLENPSHTQLNNHPLSGDKIDQWIINITGDWRVIYVFNDKDVIVFIDVDTHSNLYE